MEKKKISFLSRAAMLLLVMMLTTTMAWATTTSTITVGGTDYTLFTGFTATDGNGNNWANLVDGNTSTDWMAQKTENHLPMPGEPDPAPDAPPAPTGDFAGGTEDPAFVEFHADAPIIPKGYVLTCDHENAGFWKPVEWALKAKLNEGDTWTTIHSSNTTLGAGKTFEISCSNDGNNKYQYFRFEVYEVGATTLVDLDELQFYGFENLTYTHLTKRDATCTEVGIKQECYRRSDGKYFTDETGATELAESAVIDPMIPHTGVHHDADANHIEYWQCSMCNKYFSDAGCANEITESQTHVVKYLDGNGTLTTLDANATTVTSSATSWNDGWYVVYDDVTITDRISVSGTVNLILCNGATLTASKGIGVGSDATFNIYAQSDDKATMGALIATATTGNNAGIGGGNYSNFGTININGGKITATGNNAGIGGGYGSTSGNITINGGIVNATAGDYSNSAGIGGGNNGYVASVTLNGGIITATGDTYYGGAGIGTGSYGGNGTMTITIGSGVKKLVATKGYGSECIGKQPNASTTVNVVFKNGNTTVTGDDKDAVFYDTGEGSQRQVRAKAMNHAVAMSDDLKANITLNTEYALEGETITLTLGAAVDASTLKVNDGTSDLTLTDAGNRQYTFTMPDGNVTVTVTVAQSYTVTLPANMEVVSATNAADANGKYITGTTVTFKASFPYAASDVSDGTNTLTATDGIYSVTIGTADVTITATVERSSTINLSDANGDFTAIEGDVLTGTTSHTVTIADGAGISLSGATISGGIVCEGTATITLVGTNSTTGAQYKAGIQIGGSGTTLTINGDGTLTANGGTDAAGIGLNRAWNVTEDVVGGNIVINGGNITANGGGGGAGIGAGVTKDTKNSSSRKAIVGNITIAGGSVTAVGGSSADGIGAGKNDYNATIQIGTVTIYDGIEMVDATSIKDFASVVYMHGETNVTASKTEYFNIGENGDRRIIVPKDDTDYTITIADGIEHGTLTVAAATAKYMETVTINATPDFGYRLVRFVVKDADDNDVASTGNTFLMPKSSVTVSAVFEQGTHGTTEFVWGYLGPSSIVNEATIYDGVTTVNIQNIETSYNILKYDGSYFLLDNDTYVANIPYAGGTGEFNGVGITTNFNVPYDGETGYYDVTLTDAGNGKWNVSILKTAGQMDVVPDQTYTGSEITPEPLVIAGSLNLIQGTDYVYSYTNNTNAGTAKVRATFQGDYESLGYVEKEFNILPSTVMVSVTGSGTVTCGDRSATDGTSFGVMSEKGASVALTLAPTDGNAVRSVEYGYTNSNEMTTNGAKLPINGTTATLTVPDDLKDGTGVTVTVTFAPALNGGADEASAVALTDATVTDLGGGWYKVDSDITFDHTLNLLGDTHLIIDNGKTMTVNTASNRGIDSDYTLTVSGAGALNVTTTSSGVAVRVGNYVQTGATVTASGYIGIRCTDNFIAFNFDNDFTFSGGQLTATGSGGDGIWADNDITLSCTNATDFIQASSYSSAYGAVKIAEGNALTDGTEASNGMNGYSGTLTNEQITAIGGKTLRPFKTITLADNADNSSTISEWNGGVAEVTLSDRTLYKDGNWNTLCLPFDVTVADSPLSGDNVVAKVLNATESSLDSDGKLTLKFSVAPATIPAGTPFIVKWNNTGIDLVNPVFNGVIVNNAATSVDFTDGSASFVGTYSPFAITDENRHSVLLLTNSGKLGYSKVNRTLGSCRAYILTTGTQAAREFVVDFGDGETTNIQQVESGKLKVEGYYDLQGRKVAQPTKGLYIVNGKKVVVK